MGRQLNLLARPLGNVRSHLGEMALLESYVAAGAGVIATLIGLVLTGSSSSQQLDIECFSVKKQAENKSWLSGAFWSNGKLGCTA